MDDMGRVSAWFTTRLDIHRCRDIRAATTDKDADPGSSPAAISLSGGYSFVLISVPRASLRRERALAAAPLAWMTLSGMSFGSRKLPHT